MIQSFDLLLRVVVAFLTNKTVHGIASSAGSRHGLREKGRRSWCAHQTDKIVCKVADPAEEKGITKSPQPSLNLNSTTPIFHGFVNE